MQAVNRVISYKKYASGLLLGKTVSILFFILAVLSCNEVLADQNEISKLTIKSDNNQQLLEKMHQAVVNSNYEISFVSTKNGNLGETFKYRHINVDNQSFAQFSNLEGPAKEIILRNNIVSYFQLDNEPFSIHSARITEAFPDIIFNNFNELGQYYDFFVLGKARTSNRSSLLVRVIAKDKDRYSYIIWIDDHTFLPLRIDLFDLDNQLLEQFKVVDLSPLTQIDDFRKYIEEAAKPTLLAANRQTSTNDISWQLKWLPNGFIEHSYSTLDFKNTGIQTRLFSDGVFSFTVNLSDETKIKATNIMWQGNRVIYSSNILHKDVVIIGNLPLETIQQIAKNIIITPDSSH